jgi:hypothetical protein
MWPGLNTVKSAVLRPHKSPTFLEAVLLTTDYFIVSPLATVSNKRRTFRGLLSSQEMFYYPTCRVDT